MKKIRLAQSLWPVWMALCSPSLPALQAVPVHDGATVTVSVSSRGTTRLYVQNAKITDVWGKDLTSSDTGPPGQIIVQKDDKRGQLFMRFRSPPKEKDGFNLFIGDENGAMYTLILHPDSGLEAHTVALTPTGRTGGAKRERAQPHIANIKNLMRAMANEQAPSGYSVRENAKKENLAKWKNIELVLLREYAGEQMTGRVLQLTNTGKNTQVYSETEFADEGVLSVAIERWTLAPQERTLVYVIEGRP